MTFDDLLEDAKELLDIRPDGWTRPIDKDMIKLTEEVGEIAECFSKSRKTDEDLAEEISDAFIVLATIAVRKGIDLSAACRNKQIKRVEKLVNRFHGGTYPSR